MRQFLFLIAVIPAALTACGKTTPTSAPAPADVGEGLKELGEVYKYRAAQRLPPPSRAEDLAEQEGALEHAMQPIREGQIVVAWRAGYSPSSTDVLAHEKDAATNGGKVLLRNGTVKEMTAAEFKSARK